MATRSIPDFTAAQWTGGFATAFVNALHSSSFGMKDGQNVYLGNPTGLVLHFPDDKTLYHMGDTHGADRRTA
jgi:L-ascorbate metabolism protein UlaG (beta-lactamase superfamily)